MPEERGSASGSDTPSRTPPAVVEHGYQTWLWIDERVAGFPVAARRQLGHRIVDAALWALVATMSAAYARRGPTRLSLLHDAARELTVFRLLLRGARPAPHLGGFIDVEDHARLASARIHPPT
jgi:hypothetical protein